MYFNISFCFSIDLPQTKTVYFDCAIKNFFIIAELQTFVSTEVSVTNSFHVRGSPADWLSATCKSKVSNPTTKTGLAITSFSIIPITTPAKDVSND